MGDDELSGPAGHGAGGVVSVEPADVVAQRGRSPILIRSCLLGLRVLAVVFADGGLGGGQVLIGAAGGDQPISIWICRAMPGDAGRCVCWGRRATTGSGRPGSRRCR